MDLSSMELFFPLWNCSHFESVHNFRLKKCLASINSVLPAGFIRDISLFLIYKNQMCFIFSSFIIYIPTPPPTIQFFLNCGLLTLTTPWCRNSSVIPVIHIFLLCFSPHFLMSLLRWENRQRLYEVLKRQVYHAE